MHTRIDRVVKESGLTKTAFGKRIGIGQSMTSMICNGTAKPSDRTIADICREFGISRQWLETGEGPMRYPEPDSNMAIINRLLADDPDEVVQFVTKFMAAYETLPDSSKAVLCDLIRSLHEK